MILQYLSDEGYYSSRAVVHDEANVKWKEREERGIEAKRLKQAILGKLLTMLAMCPFHQLIFFFLDGDWSEVEKLSSKPIVKNHRSFLYSLYKQQYLEYIEHREIQKV